MEDFDPELHRADCAVIGLLSIGEELDQTFATILAYLPGIEWDEVETEPVYGVLRIRHFEIDVCLSLNGGGLLTLCLESVPAGKYFDKELVCQLEDICRSTGWTITLTNSEKDEFI